MVVGSVAVSEKGESQERLPDQASPLCLPPLCLMLSLACACPFPLPTALAKCAVCLTGGSKRGF